MSASTMHRPSSACPLAIQTASLQLHYLAEGAANVIYSVSVLDPPSLQHHSHCCVMRLRKDLSFTKPAREVMADFGSRIVPLFGDQYRGLLMEQERFDLTEDMVRTANDELHEMDGVDLSELTTTGTNVVDAEAKKVRGNHRRHVYLPSFEDEQCGILMQNLQGPGVDYLVEFKPKWLVQSPSAPKDARNCRTCALNASRRKEGKHKGRGDSGFCPFDLLVGMEEEEILTRALQKIWPVENGIEKFVAAFRDNVQPALRHLQKLEEEHGSVGLEDFRNPAGKDFGVAMALRDCSVFLALSRADSEQGGVHVVDIKFADLDLKTTEGGKIEKWAAMEQELLDGAWYYSLEGSDCSLSRVGS